MEKTIMIDGKPVTFKSSGGTLIRYRNQFNQEFLTDYTALLNANGRLESFTTKSIEQMIWALAKTADDRIPDLLSWYDSFETFDIWEVWSELSALVSQTLEPLQNRIKNVQAAAGK